MIGAILSTKSEQSRRISKWLVAFHNFCPVLHGLRAFGIDGDQALVNAMKSVFPESLHLMCDLHMKDNVFSGLANCGVPKEFHEKVVCGIFGCRNGNQRGMY